MTGANGEISGVMDKMSSTLSVADAIAELQDLTRCRCHPAFTDRKLHDPACNCDSAEAVQVVAAEINRLRSSRRDMHRRAQSAEGRMTRITHYALGMVQRDKARKVMPRDGEAILRAARADSGSAFLLGWSVWEPELKAARAAIARLTRERDEARAVKVKPLVWTDFDGRGAKATAMLIASYLIAMRSDGRFEVSVSAPGYSTFFDGDQFYPDIEAAKTAAQADYESRIRAALGEAG